MFLVLTPALIVLTLLLPTADWQDTSYNTLVFGSVYNYGHLRVINATYVPAARDERTTRAQAAPTSATQALKSGVKAERTTPTQRLSPPAAAAAATPTTHTTAKAAPASGNEPINLQPARVFTVREARDQTRPR